MFVLCIFVGYVYHTDLKSCKTAPSSVAMDARRVAKPASVSISVAQEFRPFCLAVELARLALP